MGGSTSWRKTFRRLDHLQPRRPLSRLCGPARVTPNFVDYLWSRLATREQRAQLQAFLPTEYSNFDLDPEGFIYATVVDRDESAASTRHDRVKLLNPKGEDLLRRIGFHPPIGDVQFPDRWSTASQRGSSLLADVVVHELGVYSVLDSNRGRVFTYDSNGNLLYVFGYRGTDHGRVVQPVALARKGHQMMILDAQQGAIVVFEPTEYALLIWAAMHAYHRGEYQETERSGAKSWSSTPTTTWRTRELDGRFSGGANTPKRCAISGWATTVATTLRPSPYTAGE